MKISSSKKQLAKIISENGGWRDGANLALFGKESGRCFLLKADEYPVYNATLKCFLVNASDVVYNFKSKPFANWHQTIITRDEYFRLYPAPDADGWIEWSGGECQVERGTLIDVRHRNKEEYIGVPALGRWNYAWFRSGINPDDIIAYRPHKPEQSKSTAVGDDETNLAAKEELEALEFEPAKTTIEQLAADYRAKLAIARRAQEEADSHRCGAEAALEKLVAAGKALGLVLGIDKTVGGKIINSWRDLKAGDVIRIRSIYRDDGDESFLGCIGMEAVVTEVPGMLDSYHPIKVDIYGGKPRVKSFDFIRRP